MENSVKINNMAENIEKVIVGKREIIDLTLVSLLAGGHVLLEDVPGVGKTTLAKALAKTIDCDFKRIQFTPDTLPSDITGLSIYNMATSKFEFHEGLIMSNIILADEINRTSPKTQSSLLEAMEENQVSAEGNTYALPDPFMVIATQNPVDTLGTFYLPEAQLDRFLMKLSIGYPSEEKEADMIQKMLNKEDVKSLTPVITAAEILQIKEEVKKVKVEENVLKYIVEIITKTRNNLNLMLGASPRATKALLRAAQAKAFMSDRDFVIPEDVIYLAPYVIPHRLVLSQEGRIGGADATKILNDIVRETKVPLK